MLDKGHYLEFRGRTGEALAVWKRIGGEAVDFAAAALQKCEDDALLAEYAPWVIEQNPQSGLDVFMKSTRRIPVPNDVVLKAVKDAKLNPDDFKDKDHPVVTILLWIVRAKGEGRERIHTELGLQLIAGVRSLRQTEDWSPYDLPPSSSIDRSGMSEATRSILEHAQGEKLESRVRIEAGHESGMLGFRRGRLLRFLRWSGNKANPETLLEQCSPTMFEEQMELNGLLGRHRAALDIAVGKMVDFNKAEEYCTLRSKSSFGDPLREYLQLIQDAEGGAKSWRMHLLSSLMAKYANRLSSADVVSFVEPTRPIESLKEFAVKSIPTRHAEAQSSLFLVRLSRYVSLSTRERLARLQRRGIVLSRDSTCSISGKKIGDSAFVLYPSLRPVLMSEVDRGISKAQLARTAEAGGRSRMKRGPMSGAGGVIWG